MSEYQPRTPERLIEILRVSNPNPHSFQQEAADEIDRLRAWAEDEQEKRHKAEEDRAEARSEIERLSAEVKRLGARPQSPTNTIEHFDDLISPQQEPA